MNITVQKISTAPNPTKDDMDCCAERTYFTFNIASSWQSPTYIIDGCFFFLEL